MMKALRVAALVGLTLASACIGEDVTRCADGTLCPAGFACFVPSEGPPSCQRAESFEVCADLAEGDICTVPGSFTGACYQEVCLEVACGNGITQPGEGCDDGNLTSGDGCDGRCLSDETCGNGYRDPGEACDAGAANADTPDAGCRTTCQAPACGDGVTDPGRGETCDDGNQVPGDGCTFACIVESCGNGIVDFFAGEQCDDGEAANSNAPDAHCRPTCLFPSCGDGVRDPGRDEACDEGVANSEAPNATCRTDCQAARCGDGVTDDGTGEACDDANNSSGDGCRGDCLSDETCGNGVVDAFSGEVCDDGNGWRHDGCSGCQVEDISWTDASTITGPPGGYCAAFDRQRKVWVAFGGVRNGGYTSETWELHDTTWRRRTPPVLPPGRAQCGMGYDVARGRIVVHGGVGDTGFQRSDTWEWDGETWVDAGSNGGISYRSTLTYVGSRHALWEYGRSDSASMWEWSGAAWDYLGEGPPARSQPAIAYDPVRDEIVMFGGRAATYFNDTWTWDGVTWTQHFPATVPPAAVSAEGWYSTRHQQVMMHLGDGNVWAWDGSDWHATPTGVSFAYRWDGLQVDIEDDVAMVAGVPYDLDLSTPQVWLARAVVSAPLRPGAAGAWNDSSAQYELFGGTNGGETDDFYIRRQGEWRKVLPAPGAPWPAARIAHAMAYDPLRRRTVLHGGASAGVVRDDLWEWDGTSWSEVPHPPGAPWPTAGRDSAMVFAPTLGEVLLIGGRASAGNDVRADVWSWNGTAWTRRADMPQALAALSPAWDRDRDVLVLYGAFDPAWAGKRLQYTYEWTPDVWTFAAYSSPTTPMRYFAAAVYDPMRRKVVLHGGSGFGSVLSDTWEWVPLDPLGAQWRQISGSGPRTSGLQAFYDTEASELVALSNAGSALGEWRMRRDSPLPEESCALGNDGDTDGLEACDDPDCWWTCTPSCPPESSCAPELPACGDGTCDPVESCDRCALDCGTCATVCGDNQCAGGEDEAGCPGDCTP